MIRYSKGEMSFIIANLMRFIPDARQRFIGLIAIFNNTRKNIIHSAVFVDRDIDSLLFKFGKIALSRVDKFV